MKMIKNFFPLACFAASMACSAEPPLADGFYEQTEKPSARKIMSQDNVLLHLGEKYQPTIQEAYISAQDNANTYFGVALTVPYDAQLDTARKTLVVNGVAYRSAGGGSSQQQTSSLYFMVQGQARAMEVAQYLAIKPRLRHHPGHQLAVMFTPVKNEFVSGEEVKAVLSIKNVGTTPVAFMKGGKNRGKRDNQYAFSARHEMKSVADIGDGVHFGGLAQRRVIKPGETFEDTISLSKWFAFDKPGIYELLGSYSMDFSDAQDEKWWTIWQDYATAEFVVRVKKL